MAKDYFQDILPPSGEPSPKIGEGARAPAPLPPAPAASPPGERSIRNITVSPRPRRVGMDMRETASPDMGGAPTRRFPKRLWIWSVAGLSLLALAVLGLLALRPTTVSVIPRAHTVTFDQASRYTAFPAASAATGTLSYTVSLSDIEDSAVVASSGTQHAEEKASGTIVVLNDFSSAPVKLIKNTRFATPEGLIFRVPEEAVIPGKKGASPGEVSITVFADKPGAEYNVGPVARWTLPGLKSSPDMYARVYARSSAAMTGGFVGDKPGVAPDVLAAARAEVRARLLSKVGEQAAGLSSSGSSTVFPQLMQVSYISLPDTTEGGGGLRIHEKIHAEAPVFPAGAFARAVAEGVSADYENASITLKPGSGFEANPVGAPSDTILGTSPLNFALGGEAQLVWSVDKSALAAALAGRDAAAFQTIVSGFPGVQEAHARIEPFWRVSFPSDPASIKINVGAPAAN